MREKTPENLQMGYSAAYPTDAERGFFSWRFLEVKREGEGEQWKILVIVKVAFTLGVLIEL